MKITADRYIPFLKGVFEPYAEVVYKDGMEITPDDARDSDALIVRTRTACNASLLEGGKVRMVATATIGTDHIDLPWCAEHGIEVANASGCNAGGVMQYVFTAIYTIACRKNIDLEGKTIGIIGVGNVGKRVEGLARKLGFKLLLCDPPRAAAEGPEAFCSLDELLRNSDIVTMHTYLDGTTFHMADEDFFSRMKDGAVFINASRGEVVVDEALKDAAGRLGAVIIDTWNHEPGIDMELLELADIATPHIAGYSYQGKQNGTSMAVRAVARHFGLDSLKDYYPATESPEKEIVTLRFYGLTREQTRDLMLSAYDIEADDRRFRSNPATFEKQRSGYDYRREFNY